VPNERLPETCEERGTREEGSGGETSQEIDVNN